MTPWWRVEDDRPLVEQERDMAAIAAANRTAAKAVMLRDRLAREARAARFWRSPTPVYCQRCGAGQDEAQECRVASCGLRIATNIGEAA